MTGYREDIALAAYAVHLGFAVQPDGNGSDVFSPEGFPICYLIFALGEWAVIRSADLGWYACKDDAPTQRFSSLKKALDAVKIAHP